MNVLSCNDLYADFVSEHIITLSEFHELSSCTNTIRKAERFLVEKIYPPVGVGLNTIFYIMLNIMKNDGNTAAREL